MSPTTEACVNPTLLTRGAGERQPEPPSQSAEDHHATNRASPHPGHTPGVGETGPSMHWSNDQGMPMGMDANASSSQFMHTTSAHEEIARFLLEDYMSPPAGSHPRPTTSNPHHSIPPPQGDLMNLRDRSIEAVMQALIDEILVVVADAQLMRRISNDALDRVFGGRGFNR